MTITMFFIILGKLHVFTWSFLSVVRATPVWWSITSNGLLLSSRISRKETWSKQSLSSEWIWLYPSFRVLRGIGSYSSFVNGPSNTLRWMDSCVRLFSDKSKCSNLNRYLKAEGWINLIELPTKLRLSMGKPGNCAISTNWLWSKLAIT